MMKDMSNQKQFTEHESAPPMKKKARFEDLSTEQDYRQTETDVERKQILVTSKTENEDSTLQASTRENIVYDDEAVRRAVLADQKSRDKAFNPYFADGRKIKSFERIKNHILRLLISGKFSEVKNYLATVFKGREKDFFYGEHGEIIFEQALNFIANYRALECVLQYMEVETIQKFLQQDNWRMLKIFVEQESELMETYLSSTEKENVHMKLSMLYNKDCSVFHKLKNSTCDVITSNLWDLLKNKFSKKYRSVSYDL